MNFVHYSKIDVTPFLVSCSVRQLKNLGVCRKDTNASLIFPCILLIWVNHQAHCVDGIVKNRCLRIIIAGTNKIGALIAHDRFCQGQSGAGFTLCVFSADQQHDFLKTIDVSFKPRGIDIRFISKFKTINHFDKRFLPLHEFHRLPVKRRLCEPDAVFHKVYSCFCICGVIYIPRVSHIGDEIIKFCDKFSTCNYFATPDCFSVF